MLELGTSHGVNFYPALGAPHAWHLGFIATATADCSASPLLPLSHHLNQLLLESRRDIKLAQRNGSEQGGNQLLQHVI